MIYKISKHHYYIDKGRGVDRGITRSWDSWYSYERSLVKVIFVNEDNPMDRRSIIIKVDNFNEEDYAIGLRYEVTKKLFRKEEWRKVSDNYGV